ncbi:hypothetical protein [Paraburkholderia sp. J94]|uniref:hypothetical protein n=1 Tax=Paraburkholderia sp. J94 TaxID=2805441 RepID=UPI002AB197CE|nr:hypothetical protein [Paraburkholderia sp. J94]
MQNLHDGADRQQRKAVADHDADFFRAMTPGIRPERCIGRKLLQPRTRHCRHPRVMLVCVPERHLSVHLSQRVSKGRGRGRLRPILGGFAHKGAASASGGGWDEFRRAAVGIGQGRWRKKWRAYDAALLATSAPV